MPLTIHWKYPNPNQSAHLFSSSTLVNFTKAACTCAKCCPGFEPHVARPKPPIFTKVGSGPTSRKASASSPSKPQLEGYRSTMIFKLLHDLCSYYIGIASLVSNYQTLIVTIRYHDTEQTTLTLIVTDLLPIYAGPFCTWNTPAFVEKVVWFIKGLASPNGFFPQIPRPLGAGWGIAFVSGCLEGYKGTPTMMETQRV